MADRRLVLIRHSKAADGPYDIDRRLAPRGERDARAIGAILTDLDISPDRVVVSPAVRARQTWEGTRVEMTNAIEMIVDERIYDNEVDALLAVVRDTPDAVRTLVLVGHNPSFAELATDLDDGDGDPVSSAARQELQDGFATSGVAVFEPAGEWSDLAPGTATLRAFAVGRDAS
jgi:phosphohistidine phosphatase